MILHGFRSSRSKTLQGSKARGSSCRRCLLEPTNALLRCDSDLSDLRITAVPLNSEAVVDRFLNSITNSPPMTTFSSETRQKFAKHPPLFESVVATAFPSLSAFRTKETRWFGPNSAYHPAYRHLMRKGKCRE